MNDINDFDNLFGRKKRKTAAGKIMQSATGQAVAAIAPTKKERRKNKRQQKKGKVAATIVALAQRDNLPVQEVAKQQVEANRPAIEKYVISQGETPKDTTEDLATQAADLRSEQIEEIAMAEMLPIEDAEFQLEEDEQLLEDDNSADADSFLGKNEPSVYLASDYANPKSDLYIGDLLNDDDENDSFLGGVLQVAGGINKRIGGATGIQGDTGGGVVGGLLKKVSEKRAAKGKKPGLIGFMSKLAGNTQVDAARLDPKAKPILDALEIKKNEVIDSEVKLTLKRNLPFIIGGVVVLLILVFVVAKFAKK